MDEKRKVLAVLIDRAYNNIDNTKFSLLRKELLIYMQRLNNDTAYTDILHSLQYDLFHADKSLPLSKRISGLPIELVGLSNYINSQSKENEVSHKLNFWKNLRNTLSRISFYIR